MDDMNYTENKCGVRFHCSRAANSVNGLMKTIEITKRIVLTALFVMLPAYAYAEAERFPGVQDQLDGLVQTDVLVDSSTAVENSTELYAAASFEAPAQETISDQAEMIVLESAGLDVSTGGGSAQSGIANQELASLDAVVDIGASRRIQDPQPVSIISRDSASLEVVDTGVARNVQNPQPAAVVSLDAEDPVAREIEETSALHEADELNAGAVSGDDQGARNYQLMLPVTDVAENNEVKIDVVAATGTKNGQVEDISVSAVSNKLNELPYAFVLVILALMSMIPIARRNG